MLTLVLAASSSPPSCNTADVPHLDARYAPDHLNFLCMNYTRPVPLPCHAAADQWKPRWFSKSTPSRRKFVIYAWWPPNFLDFDAYAAAGFNLALTENYLGGECWKLGPNRTVTHDQLLDFNIEASTEYARRGILTVFNTGNTCNKQLARSATVAYGNRTGGRIEGRVNLTARAFGAERKPGVRARSKGQTVPELEYITTELARRGVLDQFVGIQIHDDTEVQTGETIASAAWLAEHTPNFVPFVNQVSGASGPQTLYRTGLMVSAPEQYPIQCPASDCANASTFNATHAAINQMSAYETNALDDERYGLDSWPLFHIGDSQGPFDQPDPDQDSRGSIYSMNVRSDSLVRWMGYGALAYGATGLNWYCWGGGIWWGPRFGTGDDMTKPGRPTPMYATVREVNADAGEWGDEMLAGGFGFAGALHTGFRSKLRGGGAPSAHTVVTAMSDDLLVGVFTPSALRGGGGDDASSAAAYLIIVSKQVSGQLEGLPARNVSLTLHPSVGHASVASPGPQGPRGFDELYQKHGVPKPPPGTRRDQHAHVARPLHHAAAKGSQQAAVRVTVEVVGGGAAMVRLYAGSGPSDAAALLDACFAMVTFSFDPPSVSMASLKAPEWAYDSWHARYRPYENLELTGGRSFEDGEQTPFLIGASFSGAPPPTAADEAKAWAWAGVNMMSLSAPTHEDVISWGPASRAVGAVLDHGYPFGFFVALEPPASGALDAAGGRLLPSDVSALTRNFRCHGRWYGLLLSRNASGTPADLNAATAATTAMRIAGRWTVPLATAADAKAAIELGERGVALAMPLTPSLPVGGDVIRWAHAVAATYEPMRLMLAASYVPREPPSMYPGRDGTWVSQAPMPFVAAVDACVADSDSMLRFAAFSALAYGARGLFWRGAGTCAPVGTPRFSLLASINRRVAQWGNVFVSSKASTQDFSNGGYNVTKLWATGYALPSAVAPASGGADDLVQAADDDVLVAQLGSLGRDATSLVYVVNKRVSHEAGAAGVRTVRITLRHDVTATQPVEGDCGAGRCQCGLSTLGRTIVLQLPGGSGQLVAVSFWDGA